MGINRERPWPKPLYGYGMEGFTGVQGHTGCTGATGPSGFLGSTGVCDSFPHTKTSRVQAAVNLERKADKCMSLALNLFPDHPEREIERHASDFMHMPEEAIDRMYRDLERSQTIKNINGEPVSRKPFSVNEVTKEIKRYNIGMAGFEESGNGNNDNVPLFERKSFGEWNWTKEKI